MLGLAAWALLATGCGSSGHHDAHSMHSTPNEDQVVSALAAKALPIQAYMLTEEQDKVVYRAAQRIANDCMRKQGFDVGLPNRFEVPVEGHPSSFLDRRYARVYDRVTAAAYGLHVPAFVEHPGPPPVGPTMSEAADEALFGGESDRSAIEEVDVAAGKLSYGGCMGQAESTLARGMRYPVAVGGAPAQPVRLLNLDPTAREDPAVVAAQNAWSSCMAKGGYHLASTLADVDGIPGVDVSSPRPSTAEIALALQDVACQDETHVVDIFFDVESRYETKKIDEQAQVFAEIKKENEELVQRAADFLGVDPP